MRKSIELKADLEAKEKNLDEITEKISTTDSSDESFAGLEKLFNDEEAAIEKLLNDIELAERVEKANARKADRAAAIEKKGPELAQIAKKYSVSKVFRASMGKEALEGIEKEMHEEAEREIPVGVSAEGVLIPEKFIQIGHKRGQKRGMDVIDSKNIQRVHDATITVGGGQETIDTTLGGLIPVLTPTPIIANLGATIMTGQQKNLDFPRGATRATAVWEGEVDANAETSVTFDKISLRPKRVGCYAIESKQLVIQSNIAIENYIRNMMSAALDEAIDTAAFEGSGVAPIPEGITNTSGVGAVVTGGIAGLAEDDAYKFKDALANAYALKGNLAFVTTNSLDSVFRQEQIEAGSGLRLLGGIAGQSSNEMVTGHTVLTSDLLTAGTMIFGNWSELMLAQWGGLDVVVNPYSLDTTHQIRITMNTFWDVDVKHAASFAVATDLV